MAKKKGKKKGTRKKGMKKPGRRRSRRGGSRRIPMPSMQTVFGSAFLVGMDVVDATIFDLPDDLHPWAAGLFEAGYVLKNPGLIEAAFIVELAHLGREHGITAKIVEQAAALTGKLTDADAYSGGGALTPGIVQQIREAIAAKQ
jgi:hypothetical protein